MTYLITLLISLLGYGTPSDFEHLNEAQLQEGIALTESGGQWDLPEVHSPSGE